MMMMMMMMKRHHTPHIHNRFTALFRDYPGEPVPEEILFWTSRCRGRLTEADTLKIQLGATPSRLISDPPPSSPYFYA